MLSLQEPTHGRGVQVQMQEDLYLEAARLVSALRRIQDLRTLVGKMVQKEVDVPPHAAWAVEPSLWNVEEESEVL